MNKTSLRKFQLSPTKYMGKLPLILTRYNLPVAVVIEYESWEIIRGLAKKELTNKETKEEKPVNKSVNKPLDEPKYVPEDKEIVDFSM